MLAKIEDSGAEAVIDLGCGEGKLLRDPIKDKSIKRIAGMDVSIRSLEMPTGESVWTGCRAESKLKIH